MSSAVERRDRRRLSDSPVDDHRPPSRRSSPRRERLPDHHRSPPRTRSPHRTSSRRARSPAKERLSDHARSPRKAPLSVPVRTSLSPSPRVDHKSSLRTRSPQRTSSSHRARSPAKERLPDRTRSPKHAVRTSAPGSPVPRTKRSRPTQEELEMEKLVDKEHVRKASRAEHDRGRHKEHGDEFEDQSEKRAKRNKIDDDSSRSLRRERSVSPAEPSHRNRYGSRSPPRVSKSGGRDEVREPRAAQEDMNGEDEAVARMKATEEALEAKQKQKPSFELSGKLAEETNRVRGITLLFTEPPDACKADTRWRLYVFKGGEALNEPLYVHRQTCYLFGRERRVADIPTDHPSCSKQHAVLQYRLVEKEQSDGLLSKQPGICTVTRELSSLNCPCSTWKLRRQPPMVGLPRFPFNHLTVLFHVFSVICLIILCDDSKKVSRLINATGFKWFMLPDIAPGICYAILQIIDSTNYL